LKEYREVLLDPRDPLVWEPGVSAAVEALEEGGILVHPTSTVYGIGAAATGELNAEINRLKGRPPNRSLIRLAGSVEVLRRELPGAAWDGRAEKLATEFWPGPLTLILDDGSEDGLGVRVDGHPILLVVLGRWRSLMTSTSLNLEEEPPATRHRSARQVLDAMPEPKQPTTFLAAGSLPASASSTVVSVREKATEILRRGPIDRRRIARCLGETL
jgi:L-threonylcarbamoyladenylate synthase